MSKAREDVHRRYRFEVCGGHCGIFTASLGAKSTNHVQAIGLLCRSVLTRRTMTVGTAIIIIIIVSTIRFMELGNVR